MNFEGIYGQEHIISHIKTAIKQNTVSHAYIFEGEKDAGKKFISKIFSKALQCEGENKPCMKCHQCLMSEAGNNPDIKFVTHSKPNIISVDDIREQIVSDISVKPYSSKYKIYIIDEAEKMNIQAQNAILKTLEEPPSYAVIMLLSTNADAFLDTIVSRCVTLSFRPVKEDVIMKYLMERARLTDYQARVVCAFSRGNIGKAMKMSESSDFLDLKDKVVGILKNADKENTERLVETVTELENNEENIENILELMLMWYRDVLLYKATHQSDKVVFYDEISLIKQKSRDISFEKIEEIIKAIDEFKGRLKSNVSFSLATELLLLKLK